jgi:hypothetical protein
MIKILCASLTPEARSRPSKIKSLSKGLVSKSLGRINNVFAIPTDNKKAAVAIVLNILWENLT